MALVKLQNGHLIVDSGMAADIFEGAVHVDIIYYEHDKKLLVASTADKLFKSLHKTKSYIVKEKNTKGDKAISLESIIIDTDIDGSDRELNYEADTTMKILSIYF